MKIPKRLLISFLLLGLGAGIINGISIWFGWNDPLLIIGSLIFILTALIVAQSGLTTAWMAYAWDNPENYHQHKSPRHLHPPRYSFTAILPVRHEHLVVADTIKAITKINYPDNLKQLIITCRHDDTLTIQAIRQAIKQHPQSDIQLVTYNYFPINKPHQLNIGLQHAENQIVTVFDAEDEIHPDIYSIINTVFRTSSADIIQSGVQLMNFRDSWYGILNVLEYYFWFKSGLHLFSRFHLVPLAGNTVFFKKEWLDLIGGWDEYCLTEDADVGIRMSTQGAKVKVIYDELHCTREETPVTWMQFIKQRTRWHQGFIQILNKGQWRNLPRFAQRLLAAYLLSWPWMQALLTFLLPLTWLLGQTIQIPVWLVMWTYVPLYILTLQIVLLNLGLYEFTKQYRVPYFWYYPLVIILTVIPFQLTIAYSAVRAAYRHLIGNFSWEKTAHFNLHRSPNLLKSFN